MRRIAALVIGALTAAVAFAGPAHAKSSVSVTATIDDQPLTSGSKTVRLNTKRSITLDLSIRNRGTSPVAVRALRIEGRVAGLTFFGYSTLTRFTVPAGGTDRRRVDIDLLDLGDQATGYIPAKLRVLDTARHTVATRSFVADVRGSARSTYATFTLVLALATAAVFGITLLGLARNRLSENRFVRAGLFLFSGIGIGFVLVFAVSVLRILAPTSPRWQPLVAIPAALFFILGYLTPTPTPADEWDHSPRHEGHDGYDGYEGDREEEFAE
jgi:hypothetical protein